MIVPSLRSSFHTTNTLGPCTNEHRMVPLSVLILFLFPFRIPSALSLLRVLLSIGSAGGERGPRSVLASFPAVFYAATTTTTAVPSRPPPLRGPNTFELVVSLTRLVPQRRARSLYASLDRFAVSDMKPRASENHAVSIARLIFNIFQIARFTIKEVYILI